MARSVAEPCRSDPVRELDSIRPEPVKAGLRSDPIGLNRVMTEAVIAHYGSVKAAAITLDVDPSLMMREFKEGKFGRLDKVDEATKAAIASALSEAFGTLTSPQARARKTIRDIRRLIDELDRYVEVA